MIVQYVSYKNKDDRLREVEEVGMAQYESFIAERLTQRKVRKKGNKIKKNK